MDFSSAFEIVDYSLLIQQLGTSLGSSGFCSKLISSHLSNKSSIVSINKSHSIFSFFPFGVP